MEDKDKFLELKKRNRALCKSDMELKNEVVSALPCMVLLATDSICNLKCIMCFQRRYDELRNQFQATPLDEQTFIKFAEQVFPAAEALQLNIAGEPLLSRTIDLEIEYADKFAVKLDIITNGCFLDADYKNIDKLLSNAQTISFSFDSPIKNTYESIRIGADFKRVVENMFFFKKYRESINSQERPGFHITMILLKRNLDEVLPMIDFCKALGVDHLNIASLVASNEGIKAEMIDDKVKANNVFLAARKRAAEKKLAISMPPFYPINADLHEGDPKGVGTKSASSEEELKFCCFLWERAWIDMNGNIIACCSGANPIMGNIRDNNFKEIWNGEKYRKLRRTFIGKEGDPGCYACAKEGYLSKSVV